MPEELDQQQQALTPEAGQTPSAPGSESKGYTADALRVMMREEIGAHLQGFAQSLDGRLAPVEELAAAVKNLMPRTARTEALLDRMFRGTMTEADYASVTEKLEQDDLKAQLKTREDADRKAAERQLGRGQGDDTGSQWNTIFGPELMAYAEGRGVTYGQAYPSFPKTLTPTQGDPTGWVRFMREARAAIDKQEDADRKAATPRTRVDTTRPAGTKEPADLSKGGLSLFQKHFESRQRGA